MAELKALGEVRQATFGPLLADSVEKVFGCDA
jgi:hypothetical protein